MPPTGPVKLDYAHVVTKRKWPIYGIVITLLGCTFIILFGGAMTIALVMQFLEQKRITIWQVLLLPFIIAFLWGGVLGLVQAIRTLKHGELKKYHGRDEGGRLLF